MIVLNILGYLCRNKQISYAALMLAQRRSRWLNMEYKPEVNVYLHQR